MSFSKDPKHNLSPGSIPEAPFIYPYTADKPLRRAQLWNNLQTGILLEDSGLFLPWHTPYAALDAVAEQKRDQGDRTTWYLGHRSILDGYACHATVLMWKTGPVSRPINKIEEFLGVDTDGSRKFLAAKAKLTETLGEPTKSDHGSDGGLELGTVAWKSGNIYVHLIGIEQFANKYFLYVGLPD